MERRLMSWRGGSASQPQVTPYQHLELDDGWREWENTKQELVLVKRQLGEKDALILQLKTGTRRLQETLRKKDKDLHAAFAILRSPQEAKTTKTRKQELIDRLVSECMQRAVAAEALAEERRRELDRLKYSSKFLRFQELEVEIEECHTEIERLRAKIETTIVPSPIVTGKLRVSSVPLLPANGAAGLTKKIKLDPLSLPEDEDSDNQPSASAPTNVTRMYSSHSAAGQVRVVPLVKFEQREGFVSKTRRRALEAEYYKQVRLAQLEVECELEENLHIRAAREAKRLHSMELQVTQAELVRDTVRSQLATLEVSSSPANVLGVECTNEVQLSDGPEGTSDNEGKPEQGQTPTIQASETETSTIEQVVAVEPHHADDDNAEMERIGTPSQNFKLEEKPRDEHQADMEVEVFHEKDADNFSDKEPKHLKQKTYEDDDFDASDEGAHGAGGVEHTVWNADPNPHGSYQLDDHRVSVDRLATVNSDDDSDNRANNTVWNVDPIPAFSDSTPTKAEYSEENDVGSVVWNLDPRSIPSQDSTVLLGGFVDDKDDDVGEEIPHTPVQLEHSTHDTNQVWNLDPNPSDSVKLDNASDDESFSSGQEVHATDTEERQVWSLDPAPSRSVPRETDGNGELSSRDNKNGVELASEVGPNSLEEGSTGATLTGDQSPSDSSETAKNENASDCPEPPPSSSPAPSEDKLLCSDFTNRSELVDPNAGVRDVAGDDNNTTKTWNLDPVASSRHDSVDGTSPGNNGDERSVWNLDPQSGDASEPNNSVIEMDDPLCGEGGGDAAARQLNNDNPQNDVGASSDENEPTSSRSEASAPDASPPNPIEVETTATVPLQTGEQLIAPPGAPDFDEGINTALGGGMVEEPEPADHTYEDASQQNSPRESEEDNPMDDDATPEYTPPSSARDESGDDNGDDTTW
ncbi:hypothetical protein PRIC1_008662 [Phytophthora ramorum]